MEEPFFTKALIEDGRIVSYHFANSGAKAAELWFKEMTSWFDQWKRGQPFLLLMDFSAPDNPLSAEMLRGIREVARARPEIPGKIAVLVDRTEPSRSVKVALDNALASAQERRLFDEQTDALRWLLEPVSAALPYNRVWIHEGLILHFSFQDTARATVEAWFQDMVTLFHTWTESRPLLILIDVHAQGVIVSAQALMRARQISHVTPDIPGRTAILIGSPITAHVISRLVRTGLAPGKRQRLIFGDEARAIAWLLEAAKPRL